MSQSKVKGGAVETKDEGRGGAEGPERARRLGEDWNLLLISAKVHTGLGHCGKQLST